MSGNGKAPIPFAVPPGTPLVGQPVTLLSLYIPVTVTFVCNCTVDEDRVPLTIHDGVAVQCPRCRKTYNAFQHPEKLQMRIGQPAPEIVPS
jgi:hypothetical protein